MRKYYFYQYFVPNGTLGFWGKELILSAMRQRDFLPRSARLRNDDDCAERRKKKGKNCSAIFPFLSFYLP